MAEINYIIGESNTEKVRTQIALILADELANQRTLLEALPTPTPEEELSLESIPSKVWEERFIRPGEGDYPVCNVILTTNPLNELTGIEQQTDMAQFAIEYYSRAKSKTNECGDKQSSIKLQRFLMTCRHIIMSPHYITLGFAPGFIGHVSASNLQIAQPNDGIDHGYLINGQITINVKIKETQNKIEGVSLLESGTTHKLYDTDKGYYYEIQ